MLAEQGMAYEAAEKSFKGGSITAIGRGILSAIAAILERSGPSAISVHPLRN